MGAVFLLVVRAIRFSWHGNAAGSVMVVGGQFVDILLCIIITCALSSYALGQVSALNFTGVNPE